MIRINGFLHRDRLATIIDRWVDPGPASQSEIGELKRIIHFNAYVGYPILDAFSQMLFTALHGAPVQSFSVKTKGELKDFVIRRPLYTNARIEEMIAHYRRYPEDFYRETPFNGLVFHQGPDGGTYLGSARVKRFRRIAEKTSRYLIDYLFQEIKAQADLLATERALKLGVPRNQLMTPLEQQIEEFFHAERRVRKAIRTGQFMRSLPIPPINDILGVKVVTEADQFERVIQLLVHGDNVSIQERETHTGNYNATNLLVRYRWPREAMLRLAPSKKIQSILQKRGCGTDVAKAFEEFIGNAEAEVVIEVSLTSYEEMLESELGRSMHEERILAQRRDQQYRGSLARNIEYLLGYLFRFALSATNELSEVPIRLWARYMPDYIDQLHQRLKQSAEDDEFLQVRFRPSF